MNVSENLKMLAAHMDMELNNILNYWISNTIDLNNGGFYGQIDGKGILHPGAPKGSVLNTRILWTFAAAYKYKKDSRYLDMAKRAKEYIFNYFIDKKYGGIFWTLDYKGKVLEPKKQIYAIAFAIYAFSEYYKISGDRNVLTKAIELYNLIEKYSFDSNYDGYFEAFSREWNNIDDLRLSDKDANEKKTMNTHLHILEAYTSLFKVWPDDRLKIKLEGLIHIFLYKILDKTSYSFNLFFDEKWNIKSDVYSFGHDIEGSWLLYEAAKTINNKSLINKVTEVSISIAENILKNAIDNDGGLFNEIKNKRVVDTDKHWWPQAEAIVGFLNAFEISANEKFAEAAFNVWNFINKYIIDKTKGEWFFRVNKEGLVYKNEDKVGLWKCPYHNSRCCIEAVERIGRLI
jgi:mannobiose 2-epimerase